MINKSNLTKPEWEFVEQMSGLTIKYMKDMQELAEKSGLSKVKVAELTEGNLFAMFQTLYRENAVHALVRLAHSASNEFLLANPNDHTVIKEDMPEERNPLVG